MRQHQHHPWAQRAGNTKTCLNHEPKTPGSRLALWTSGCAACNDFIPKKVGHWAWGTGSPPIFPGSIPSLSPIISSCAQSSSRRSGASPGTAFHPRAFSCARKSLHSLDLPVLASPLPQERAAALGSSWDNGGGLCCNREPAAGPSGPRAPQQSQLKGGCAAPPRAPHPIHFSFPQGSSLVPKGRNREQRETRESRARPYRAQG